MLSLRNLLIVAFEAGGGMVFTKVHHPGTRANNYFKRGVDRAVPRIEQLKNNLINSL